MGNHVRNLYKSAIVTNSFLTDCFATNQPVSNFHIALESSKRSALPREMFTENPQFFFQGNDLL